MRRFAFLVAALLPLVGCGGPVRLDVVSDACLNDPQKVAPGVCGCGVAEDRCTPLLDALVHRYAFEGEGDVAVDDVGGADASIVSARLSGLGELRLDREADEEQYAELPAGIISELGSATFEAWLIWDQPPAEPSPFWERIFDFGVSTAGEGEREFGDSYLFLAPGAPGTTPEQPRTAFRDAATDGEVVVNGDAPFPTDTVFHVAVVVDEGAQELRLYLNAKEQGKVALTEPLSAIDDVNNWLGRSQFIADTRFGGSFLEFRIYAAALTPAELSDSFELGPSPEFLRAPARESAR